MNTQSRDDEHKAICRRLRIAFESKDQDKINRALAELRAFFRGGNMNTHTK